MSARYVIVCDDCFAVAKGESRQSIASARRMTPRGWTNPRPGTDRCPDCSEKHAIQVKKENPHGYV